MSLRCRGRPKIYIDADGYLSPALLDDDGRTEAQHWFDAGISRTQPRQFLGAVRADDLQFPLPAVRSF
ncbi:hypothetical protein GCM10007893_14540 [Paracoccus marinus]|nr:hypothetical protein GCM10007893_14540 [Paracoccus marinus]